MSKWTELFHKAENPSPSIPETSGRVQPKSILEILNKVTSAAQNIDFTVASADNEAIHKLDRPKQKAMALYLLMLAEIARVAGEYDKSGRMFATANTIISDLNPYSMN